MESFSQRGAALTPIVRHRCRSSEIRTNARVVVEASPTIFTIGFTVLRRFQVTADIDKI